MTNDETKPTLAITSSADPTNGAFTATFIFSEDVIDFVEGDIIVGNGAASNFQTISAKVYTATITPSVDGAVTIDVAADKASDAAGNNNTAATQLSVTNDETSPNVLEVTTDLADGTIGIGDAINIYVQYDEEVAVTGTPKLTLETGTTDRVISYTDRSVSTLRFVYTVQEGDESTDLDVISSSALALDGGTIKDNAGNDADLTVPHGSTMGSLSMNHDIIVNAAVPTVITSSAVDIAQLSATLGGNVTDDGGSAVTERGVVYSVTTTNNDPTIGETGVAKDTNGTDTGEFSESISGLSANTQYSFKAYATNSAGTVYGAVKTFTTSGLLAPTITFADIDKIYGGADFTLDASSNSNGVISYSIEGTSNGTSLSGTNNETVTLGSVGTVTIRATQSADDIYTEGTKDVTLTITTKELTVIGLTGDDRMDNGTTDATASGEATLSGVVAGDDVSLSGTPVFTFASADVGMDIIITTTGYTLSGEDAGNYSLTQPTLSADITTVTSIHDREDPDVQIYPNPTSSKLHINTTKNMVYLIDVTGGIIEKEIVNGVIDVKDLHVGLYLIKISQQQTVRFIKR